MKGAIGRKALEKEAAFFEGIKRALKDAPVRPCRK